MTAEPPTGACLIRRVVIRNYKSIAACDVELGPLTFLVGPNGSGKSNFLDALRFVADALHFSLEHALRSRGGIREVLRQSRDEPDHFAVRLEFELPSGDRGHYALSVGGATRSSFTVYDEECLVMPAGNAREGKHFYHVSEGIVRESSVAVEPAAVPDRLYLVNLSGNAAFRPIYDALSLMGFYNLNPDVMRELQSPGPRNLLARDGSNLSGVLEGLSESTPVLKSRIEDYLSQVVPGITRVESITFGNRETLVFVQLAGKDPWPFTPAQMSDGTLRALGVLVALFQTGEEATVTPLIVGIEEPETALHPAAAAVLIDAMRDALSMRQVIVTSHSPELLDNTAVANSEILAVVAEEGRTQIGHLDEAGRSVLRDHLFTAGDLLRMNQLRPDPAASALNPEDLELFGTGAPA
jgi:predicted ATPase